MTMDDGPNSLASTQKAVGDALVTIIRGTAAIAAEDVPFHRSSDPSRIGPLLEKSTSRILRLTEQLLSRSRPLKQSSRPLTLSDVEDIDICWEQIVDVADTLLERTDTCLDEYTGLTKPKNGVDDFGRAATKARVAHRAPFQDATIPKPQLQFEVEPKNNASVPFRPFLASKPHSRVSFDRSFNTLPNDDGDHQYQHPYELEIKEYQFPQSIYTKVDPISYEPFDTTTATFVDTLEGVETMLEELKKAKEIAIDLEHHDTHSYIGIVSLMQISTRHQDWIVDTLKPWRRSLGLLNEVFADPSIIKVLHGAQMDIIWLQRDLGVYVVGLFDTYHASRVLGYPRASLAFLLQNFVGFAAQKQYQMADWRLRPLPKEMFEYARSDTHFLLYVYDCMRNELVDRSNRNEPTQDRILEVLTRSKETALQRYEHPTYTDKMTPSRNGWFSALLSRFDPTMSQLQISVFARVHRWRDQVARQEDESVNYVMPLYALFNIAQSVPEDEAALKSMLPKVTSLLQLRLNELLLVIAGAKEEAAQAPTLQDVLACSPTHIRKKDKRRQVGYATAGETENKPFAPANPVIRQTKPCLRAQSSEFWGPILDVNGSPEETVRASNRLHRLVVPLSAARFSAPPISSNSQVEGSTHNEFDPLQAHEGYQSPDSGSRKRKLNGSESEDIVNMGGASADAVVQESQQSPGAMARIERRAERKAAKRARHEPMSVQAPSSDAVSENTGAFDYETAPSVLNSRRTVPQAHKTSKSSFDPFAKAADAPTGLQRSKSSRVGKSRTFR